MAGDGTESEGPDSLILTNHSHQEVDLQIAIWRSHKASTLRRDRQSMTPIHLRRGQAMDLCKEFKLTKAEMRAVLAESPDVKRMSPGLIRITDPVEHRANLAEARKIEDAKRAARQKMLQDAARVREELRQAKQALDLQRSSLLGAILTLTGAELAPEIVVEPGQSAVVSESPSVSAAQEIQAVSESEEVAAMPKFDAAADFVPSVRWSKARLVEFAESKGISTAGLSHNQLLRKLRE